MVDFKYSHEMAHLDEVLFRLKRQALNRGFADTAVVRGERGCGKSEMVQSEREKK